MTKMTPMMAQWAQCKEHAQDAILFFRMGDFYECFYEDATLCARELEVTLTKRQEIPMAGVPHHSAEGYIDKLVSKGFRVAIAEQVEDPKQAKGLVKREIVRVVTPGTVVNSSLLPEKANNFFASITSLSGKYGLAFLDLTTGEFRVIELQEERELLNELFRIRPAEILCPKRLHCSLTQLLEELRRTHTFLISQEEDWQFDAKVTQTTLCQHFKVLNLDGFGMKGMVPGVGAAGALLTYIQDHLRLPSSHIRSIQSYSTGDFMSLDRTTQRNLELTESLQDGSRKNTLLATLDRTHTPMGGRLLRQWIKQPLLDLNQIQRRQEAVSLFLSSFSLTEELSSLLKGVRDLERLMMKVQTNMAGPKDLLSLAHSLSPLPKIKRALATLPPSLLTHLEQQLGHFEDVALHLLQALAEDPPIRVSDGGIFREGYHQELDELRALKGDAKAWLTNYQLKLKEELGIKTLKVGFNKVFGYFIEVSKGQASLMPDTFQRRQTLVNSERFISPELKEYEHRALTAQERMSALESELFLKLRSATAGHAEGVAQTAQALAQVDCLMGLAIIAKERGYTCPQMSEGRELHITDGRHPVIEASHFAESFIPNDCHMDGELERLFVITGPNMAGKSTYIRQVALLTILAQMGSFIPAKEARLGIVDKVFTRIGASDDLSRGQSTFMVEMTETANILHHATSRSLVVLDEIGRGTSTYDGISIAWAVAEYLLTTPQKQAKTLFATHYWELTRLEATVPGALNYNVAVKECNEDIVFLRKILRGGTDRSYGIHVARLAGLPQAAISRSGEILRHLEETTSGENLFDQAETRKVLGTKVSPNQEEVQLLMFEPNNTPKAPPEHQKLLQALRDLNPDAMTPLQAHTQLYTLQALLEAGDSSS